MYATFSFNGYINFNLEIKLLKIHLMEIQQKQLLMLLLELPTSFYSWQPLSLGSLF